MTASSADRRRAAPGVDELRLLSRVSRMYHEAGLRQPQIAAELGLSQARVSRLLKQAVEIGMVRTVVMTPPGVHTDLEDAVRAAYGLRDVVIVDTSGAGDDVIPALGAATATYLDATLASQHRLGISSWSETLLGVVQALPVRRVSNVVSVVQLVGGVGLPAVQIEATRLINQLAQRTGAQPLVLPAPGVVGSATVRRTLMKDRSVAEVTSAWGSLTDAIVGIGSLEPSPLLARSGNAFAAAEQTELRRAGAVGDVCFRFFTEEGQPMRGGLDERVVGISPEQLKQVPRRIGVAGGRRKYAAIRAAALGGWVNVLITDLNTGRTLARDAEPAP